MKKILLLTFTLATLLANAQSPEGMNYQAIARNASGDILASHKLGLRFTITNGNGGSKLYQEHDTVTTNQFGLFTHVVGNGVADTLSLASVPWPTVSAWMTVEMDVNGGTSYITMGSSQLLSTPYALYAKSAGSAPVGGGKPYLILTGNITDGQAATQLQQEVGSNTQFIWVLNTTQLTTLNISAVSQLVEVKIQNNTALQSVSLPNVTTIYTDLSVSSNPALSTFSMPLLSSCFSDITFGTDNIASLSFPALTYCGGIMSLLSDAFTNLSFPLLGSVVTLHLEGTSLTTATFSSLSTISGNGLTVDATALTSLSFPSLTSCHTITINSTITSIGFPALPYSQTINIGDDALTALDLSSLDSAQNLYLGSNSLLSLSVPLHTCTNINFAGAADTLISFPNLTSVTDFYASGAAIASVNLNALTTVYTSGEQFGVFNSSITSFNMPALTSFNAYELNVSNNHLTSQSVNYLLALMVSMNVSGRQIYLNGQTPPAPPTGQGVTDVQTLTNNNNVVQTD